MIIRKPGRVYNRSRSGWLGDFGCRQSRCHQSVIVTRFTEQSGREWSSDGSSDNAADELDEMGVVITRCRREEELHPRGTHTQARKGGDVENKAANKNTQ